MGDYSRSEPTTPIVSGNVGNKPLPQQQPQQPQQQQQQPQQSMFDMNLFQDNNPHNKLQTNLLNTNNDNNNINAMMTTNQLSCDSNTNKPLTQLDQQQQQQHTQTTFMTNLNQTQMQHQQQPMNKLLGIRPILY